jgi:hypothetical protein
VPNEYQKATTPTTHKRRLEKNNFGDGKKDSNISIDLPNVSCSGLYNLISSFGRIGTHNLLNRLVSILKRGR